MIDKIIIDKSDLVRIADSIRAQTGDEQLMSLNQIFAQLEDTLYILEDEAGNQLYTTLTEQKVVADATADDIRMGKSAVTESGIVVGEKEIPSYHTTEGIQVIPAGGDCNILLPDKYDYTKMQAIICAYNTSITDSVAAEKVCINDNIYAVGNTEVLAAVSIDAENAAIKLGVKNEGDSLCIIRYFTYKEMA